MNILADTQIGTGQYFNSVTGQMEALPSGAPSYGNGSSGNVDATSIWKSLGVTDAVNSVEDSIASVASRPFEFAKAQASDLMTVFRDNLLLIVGIVLVLVVVVAKSGVLGQSADLTRAIYGG